MKLILIILFTFITISLSTPIDSDKEIEDQEPNRRFKEIYDKLIETIDEDTDDDKNTLMLKNFDRECVKEKVNLTTNEEKLVPETSSLFFVLTCVFLCSKDYESIIYMELDDDITTLTNVTDKQKNIDCMKAKLKQLESKTDIFEFTMEESCSEFDENYEKMEEDLRKALDVIIQVEIIDCAGFNVTESYIKILKLALYIMEHPDDEESLKIERNSYAEYLKKLNTKIYSCLVDKLFHN